MFRRKQRKMILKNINPEAKVHDGKNSIEDLIKSPIEVLNDKQQNVDMKRKREYIVLKF